MDTKIYQRVMDSLKSAARINHEIFVKIDHDDLIVSCFDTTVFYRDTIPRPPTLKFPPSIIQSKHLEKIGDIDEIFFVDESFHVITRAGKIMTEKIITTMEPHDMQLSWVDRDLEQIESNNSFNIAFDDLKGMIESFSYSPSSCDSIEIHVLSGLLTLKNVLGTKTVCSCKVETASSMEILSKYSIHFIKNVVKVFAGMDEVRIYSGIDSPLKVRAGDRWLIMAPRVEP